MGLSVVASLMIHAAVILLIPIANPGTIVIYPVEFGEIEQTFESPRAGIPNGDAVTAPQPAASTAQQGGPLEGPETQVTVKPAPRPAPKPAPEAEPKPEPKPAPTPKPVPKPEPNPEPKPAPKPKAKPQTPQAAPPKPQKPAPAPPSGPASPAAGAPAQGAGAETGAGAASATPGTAPENVLTGKSDETVPAPPTGAAGGGGTAASGGASAATGAAEGAAGEAGRTEPGPVRPSQPSEPAGPTEAAAAQATGAPAGPPKPKGEEFGTGRALVLSGAPPVYPKNAQNEGAEGVVTLSVTVDPLGAATKVVVVTGSGDPRLDEAAMRTVSRIWRFQAIGWPYELSVRVTFRKGSVELAFGGVTVLGD